jgi:hypothetical protein
LLTYDLRVFLDGPLEDRGAFGLHAGMHMPALVCVLQDRLIPGSSDRSTGHVGDPIDP